MTHLQKLISSKQPKVGDTLFIAVDGRGGSGKTTLAALLMKKLDAQLIQTDDFASPDNPINWWPLVIEHVFEPIKNGSKTLNYPRSKRWPNHHPKPVTKVIILEGVSSLRKEFRPYINLGIFVNTPREICLQRGIDRDLGSDTGKSEAEVRAMWEKWAADEDAYIERDHPEEYADMVVDGTELLDKVIDEIVDKATPRPSVYTLATPNHTPGKAPDHETVGRKLDDLLKQHFLGKKVVIRCIGSQDHPGLSLDELTATVVRTGTDKYDPNRMGVGYEEFISKGIRVDFYGVDTEVTKDTKIMAQAVWEMHHSAIGDRGFSVHVDLVLIYDAEQLDMVMNLYSHHPTSDGFVFKDQSNKQTALLGVIKILGE